MFIEEHIIKYSDRAEAGRIYNVPYEALEESIVNAVYHKSYEIRELIEVRVLPKEIIIKSFPAPDRSVNLEALQKGKGRSARYRNRRIGDFLKELDLTEERATGIPKILRTMKANGSPSPRFESDEDRSYFFTVLPIHEEVIPGKGQSRDRVGAEPDILKALLKGPLSKKELLIHLGKKTASGHLNRIIKKLLNAACIEYTVPEKPTSRLQKYKITSAGKKIISNLSSG